MTTMSDLDEIMVAEILCRTPMTCLKTVRSVCKKWNALSKKWFFFGKAKQFLGFMMMDSRVCSLRFDLRKDLVVEPPSIKQCFQRGVSLRGNTYFFAKERYIFEGKGPEEIDVTETEDFLLCFDFTAERFGPRLPLPFHSYYAETVTLSCVKEDQLSVLCQRQPSEPSEILEIWVSTNIQPNAVSWSIFLKVDMRPLTGFQFNDMAGSFFIDQENKVAVVFDLDPSQICRYQTAYIIGQEYGGYFNSVNIGEVPNLWIPGSVGYADTTSCIPPVCSSYVPSLVQIG
ncbi:F-box associated interaction domain [Arabidopsis thaliana x Arabidopsis arenosa]|uniref:F-box associated interaction domain n=1 Tax=Arabidopsis thaliana x Arabidopsis arenosa TaxID=1240361 RepID=A0A8T2GEP4_9BRAS|nr:F-box associated interaction domain [Arabidopsis thaliana x Arabidopsis arenosa]